MNICPGCNYRGPEKTCPHDGYPLIHEELVSSVDGEPDLVGRVFDGRYQVESLLGGGGMGTVYRARHLAMGHEVALKIMRRELSRDLSAIRRFYQEARASAQLRHPHTIKVHDFGAAEDGHLFLAMELLVGRSLARVIQEESPLDIARVLGLARQICESLDEAHEQGLVHRDLKPDNVFLSEYHRTRDWVKVLDFGIAKLVTNDPGHEGVTRSGVVIGTPAYLSPEQAMARPIDRRSDLYSLGIMLYEMVTGRIPFEAPSTGALLIAQVHEPPPPLPEELGGQRVPEALRELVARLLEKKPEQRPPTAAYVEDCLTAIAERRPLPVAPPFPPTPALVVPAPLRPVPAQSGLEQATTAASEAVTPQPPEPHGPPEMTPPRSPEVTTVSPPAAATRWRTIALAATGAALVLGLLVFLLTWRPTTDATAGPPTAAPSATAPAPATPAAPAPTAPTGPAPVVPAPGELAAHAAPSPDAGTPSRPVSVRVRVESSPAGATLRDAGVDIGQTPVDLVLAAGEVRRITLSLPGHVPMERDVRPEDAPRVTVALSPTPSAPAAEPAAPPPDETPPAPPAAPKPRPKPPKPRGESYEVPLDL